MAPRDASKVQLDFPQLTADLIAALNLTGTLGLLELSDQVVPVVSVANIRPADITVLPPVFESAEVFSGFVIGPAANAVVWDTGALAAGVYDCLFGISILANSGVNNQFNVQWRNALNNANLASWTTIAAAGDILHMNSLPIGPVGLNIGLNERIRLLNSVASTGNVAGWGMVALRPTP